MMRQMKGYSGAIWDIVEGMTPIQPAIDLGGDDRTLPFATHIVAYRQPQISATYISHDLCDWRWADQFSDKQFKFVFCNHTLEDVRDPIGVLRVATRIAEKGMFGTPHWSYEFGVRGERDDWEAISGFPHHRWFVGINSQTGVYEFMAKQCWFVKGEYEFPMPNLNIEWDGGDFEFREITNEYPKRMLRADLVSWLEERWMK